MSNIDVKPISTERMFLGLREEKCMANDMRKDSVLCHLVFDAAPRGRINAWRTKHCSCKHSSANHGYVARKSHTQLVENKMAEGFNPWSPINLFEVIYHFLFWRSDFELNRLDNMPDLVDIRGHRRGNGGSWV